jgi:hypothetical protein
VVVTLNGPPVISTPIAGSNVPLKPILIGLVGYA